MPTPLPRLSLSHGQVAWALSLGQPPDEKILEQLRYLRILGVPFETSELGGGRGNRVRYRYEHLIEVGVALFGLRRGMRPREVAEMLVSQRRRLRRVYRKAFRDQPLAALEAPWVKSRGRSVPLLANEIFLRFHDRYSPAPGKVEQLAPAEIGMPPPTALAERYPGEAARTLLPLTRLVLELVAWASGAPEIKPGPTKAEPRDDR